jgi:hypothetical protein
VDILVANQALALTTIEAGSNHTAMLRNHLISK